MLRKYDDGKTKCKPGTDDWNDCRAKQLDEWAAKAKEAEQAK